VVEPEGVPIERDRFLEVVNSKLDLHRSAARHGIHGDSFLEVLIDGSNTSCDVVGLSLEAHPVPKQEPSARLPLRIVEHDADFVNGQVDPPQRLDESRLMDLCAAVPAIAGRGIHLSGRQQPDIVVVTQRVDRESADPSEPPDRQQLIVNHTGHHQASGNPRVKRDHIRT